ncbi:hypothetical protein [Streptomyces globisporus]|uniref:hypothetical protein n=1 Tax=Streptomyces globisporus TaxID=1908 RepID=UPI0004CB06C9|nr:hypothetical protein [Streptomyces globisporus]
MTAESDNAKNSDTANAGKTAGGKTTTAARRQTAKRASAASAGARDAGKSAGEATGRAGRAVADGLQSGRELVTANASKAATVAATAWTAAPPPPPRRSPREPGPIGSPLGDLPSGRGEEDARFDPPM